MIISLLVFVVCSSEIYKFLYPNEYEALIHIVTYKLEEATTYLNLKPRLINVSYNIIYYYSCSQIYYNNVKTIVSPYIILFWSSFIQMLRQHNLINTVPNKIITLYKNGNQIDEFEFGDMTKLEWIDKNLNDKDNEYNYDLIILSDRIDDSDCINKIHYTEYPQNIDYTPCNIKFMIMEIIYNTESYFIELKNDSYNHYIVNNVLNKDFFKYYLSHILKIEINDDDNFEYKMSLIDHNVKMIELNQNNYLIFKEDGYELKCVDEEQENENDDDFVKLD